MGYALKNDDFSPMQSSYAMVRKAEQNYREMINAKLINTLERMKKDDYQAVPMPKDFHQSVLKRVLANLDKDNV